MQSTILAPSRDRLCRVSARRRHGVPSLAIEGVPEPRPIADRVRAGIQNTGFSLPAGRLTVAVEPPTDCQNADLAIVLAILLADPSHAHMRRNVWVAHGRIHVDGSLQPAQAPGLRDLPSGPWVGRFWDPTDHIPEPGEDAVLSIVDVLSLHEAWDVIVGLLDIERRLLSDVTPAPSRSP